VPAFRVVLMGGASLAIVLAGAGSATAGAHPVPAAGKSAVGSGWSRAIEVPGTAALNVGGTAIAHSVSCPSTGNCAIGGFYTDGKRHDQAFVASERHGRWSKAIEVPGFAALNNVSTGSDFAGVHSISCSSAGNCAAGGFYTSVYPVEQAFVVSERNGHWGDAIEVPGTLAPASDPAANAAVNAISCPSAGNCTAAGTYFDNGTGTEQAFVVSEREWVWGTAIEVPGIDLLDGTLNSGASSVSCSSAGNCAAGGLADGGGVPFVVSERNGTWGDAFEPAGLESSASSEISALSCPKAGHCTAGGSSPLSSPQPAFLVAERHNQWGGAFEVPGLARLSAGSTTVDGLSCPAVGDCTAAGIYQDSSGLSHVFVASQTGGRWGQATEVAGPVLTPDGAQVGTLSCGSPGNCVIGGYYADSLQHDQAFVLREHDGRWGTAIELPGTGALNAGGYARVTSVSCAPTGKCAAVGVYADSSGDRQAFVATGG
jgi:hypothetical protein